jgi:RimJ/RimL family protein N-acetyltransferase
VIVLRPIRPDDSHELAAALGRMSPESRYRRFLAPVDELSDAELRYLSDVDHHDHEAILAEEPEAGQAIGVARFVRLPEDPELAEFAIAVADSWHGAGVATALLRRLTMRAREEGIRRFSAEILTENRPMLHLVRALGEVEVKERGRGAVSVEVELPDVGVGAPLARTLRAAASGLLPFRNPRRRP